MHTRTEGFDLARLDDLADATIPGAEIDARVEPRIAQNWMAAHAEAGGHPRAVHRGAQQEAFDVLARFVEVLDIAVLALEAIELHALDLGVERHTGRDAQPVAREAADAREQAGVLAQPQPDQHLTRSVITDVGDGGRQDVEHTGLLGFHQ